jgi:hypothetical protein
VSVFGTGGLLTPTEGRKNGGREGKEKQILKFIQKCKSLERSKQLCMEFYAAIKKNEILLFAGEWMELENIILSEVSQAQKTKGRMFSLFCGI